MPHPTGLQADQDDVVETAVALGDLVGHAGDGAPDVVGGHHLDPGNEDGTPRAGVTALSFGH